MNPEYPVPALSEIGKSLPQSTSRQDFAEKKPCHHSLLSSGIYPDMRTVPSLTLLIAFLAGSCAFAAPKDKVNPQGKAVGHQDLTTESSTTSSSEPVAAPAGDPPADGTTAYTDPMGGSVVTVSKSVLGGVFISCPYIHENDFVGEVTGVVDGAGSSEISVGGSPFTAGTFDESTLFPLYYLEITEPGHPYEGYSFDIISNTADSVVVSAELGSDFSVASGNEIQIRKHMTLNDFFASAESSFAAFFETVKFFNYDGSIDFYTWTGSVWSPDFGTTDVGDRQIYPGEGFLATFSSDVTFIVSGKVKTSKTVIPVPASTVYPVFFGSTSPVEETLGSLQLATAGFGDYFGTVKFFSEDGNLTAGGFYTDVGAYMSDDFGITDSSSVPVPPMTTMQISNGGLATNVVLPAPYTSTP
ncbi:MAG: hypothetical protein ACP5I4_12295 [Oceanipulchritudo sp.]